MLLPKAAGWSPMGGMVMFKVEEIESRFKRSFRREGRPEWSSEDISVLLRRIYELEGEIRKLNGDLTIKENTEPR